MMLSSCRNLILAATITAAIGCSTRAADPAAPAAPVAQQPTPARPAAQQAAPVARQAAPATEPAAAVTQQPASAAQPAATKPASEVVVTINGKGSSAAEFDRELENVERQNSRLPPEATAQLLPQLRKQAMTNLVNKQLLLQAVAARKITVGDDEIKKALDEVTKKNVPPGTTLDDALKQAGIVKSEFMQQMTESLAIQKLLEGETKSAAATDAELAKFYAENPDKFKRGESVSARHILIMFGKSDDDAKKAEKKKKIEAIRARLIKGEDFAKVCTETSEDPGSKDNGGLYEDFPRGQMVPPFENAAFSQKIGEIGPVVETSFGYHIIKVEKHTEGGVVPLAEVKDRLKAYLDGEKKQEIAQKYLKSLRDVATIVYAEGYAPPPPATAPTTAPSAGPATAPSTRSAK